MDNKPEMSPGDLLKLCPEGTDLLLVEGFKEMRGYPRVEVCRDRAPTDGDDLVCVVGHFPPPRPGVPVFSPDDIAGIADCILQKVLGR
jgi:molybdopterin-guanine dinucleotide biosynthesis protein